jgi:hypothetical protein
MVRRVNGAPAHAHPPTPPTAHISRSPAKQELHGAAPPRFRAYEHPQQKMPEASGLSDIEEAMITGPPTLRESDQVRGGGRAPGAAPGGGVRRSRTNCTTGEVPLPVGGTTNTSVRDCGFGSMKPLKKI